MDNKVKASDVKCMWRPRTPPVEKRCAKCPLGPGAHLLNDAETATIAAKRTADMGMEFHCHETVYSNVGTPNLIMNPRDQWKTCAGMVAYRTARLIELQKEMLRKQGRLIEDADEPPTHIQDDGTN